MLAITAERWNPQAVLLLKDFLVRSEHFSDSNVLTREIYNTGTILQRKKVSVRVSKEEILLILRAYREHPTRWADVLDDVRQNTDRLPAPAKELYRTGSVKQLRDRMAVKLSKLMASRENIDDPEIRQEVELIRAQERRLINQAQPAPLQGAVARPDPQMQENIARPGHQAVAQNGRQERIVGGPLHVQEAAVPPEPPLQEIAGQPAPPAQEAARRPAPQLQAAAAPPGPPLQAVPGQPAPPLQEAARQPNPPLQAVAGQPAPPLQAVAAQRVPPVQEAAPQPNPPLQRQRNQAVPNRGGNRPAGRAVDQQGPPRARAGPAPRQDRRDNIAAQLDSDDEENQPPRRRRRLADLIRENNELYNNFMRQTVPRILANFGINFD